MNDNSKNLTAAGGEPQEVTALVPSNFAEAREMASYFAKSALISAALRGKEADVLVTIAAGMELGLSPMASLRGMYVVEGKIYMGADLKVALCLRSPVCEYFRCVATTDEKAIYETKRLGHAPQTMTWTLADAKRAGLDGKDNWKKYPRRMLAKRCKSELASLVYEDLIFGVYDLDELPPETSGAAAAAALADTAHFRPPGDVIDVPPADPPMPDLPAPEPEPAAETAAGTPAAKAGESLTERMEGCTTLEQLDALVPEMMARPKAEQDETIRPLYKQVRDRIHARAGA